jgi:hypothetical protein
MFYGTFVTGLALCSITEFSPHTGIDDIPHIGQLLPDIWVDGKRLLFQYQTHADEEREGYMLTYQKPFDPYQYMEDDAAVVTTVLSPR